MTMTTRMVMKEEVLGGVLMMTLQCCLCMGVHQMKWEQVGMLVTEGVEGHPQEGVEGHVLYVSKED